MNNIAWEEVLAWKASLPEEILDLPYDFWGATTPNDQLIALYAICSGRFDCVTLLGRAGTGKTFVVRAARQVLLMQNCEVRICASTGIAAKNAGGEGTINRFAGLGTGGSTLPEGLRDQVENHWIRSSVAKRANNIAGNFEISRKDLVVFIDEVSMCSSEILLLAFQTLSRAVPNRRLRFVCTADFRQLLAISSQLTVPWKQYSNFAFDRAQFHVGGTGEDEIHEYGSLLQDGPFKVGQQKPWRAVTLSLVTNRRQAEGSWFANALNHLGDGHDLRHKAVSPLAARIWAYQEGKAHNVRTGETLEIDLLQGIHLYNRNKAVGAHNAAVLEAAKASGAKTMTYKAKIRAGAWKVEELEKEIEPIVPTMELAVGLKFMVRVNIDAHLTNGTVGVIKDVEPSRILIELANGEQRWVAEQSIPLPTTKTGVPVGEVIAIPGILAHAMTPWKSQGLTISEPLYYHLRDWYPTHGLLYVVASRVTEPELLHIVADNPKMVNKAILCQPEVKSFIKAAENNMFSILGVEPEYPEVWSMEGPSKCWVRNHLVEVVEYVANPQAEVLMDSPKCTLYGNEGCVGLFVKDRTALGEALLTDDEAFNWFVENVQFVWFKP